jgi:hypothetical protein
MPHGRVDDALSPYLHPVQRAQPVKVRRLVLRAELEARTHAALQVAKVDHDGDPKTPKWSLERDLRKIDKERA